jgi:hypothetical protein
MQINKLGLALALVAALGARVASAGDVALGIDAQWHAFDVDSFSAVSGGLEWIDLNDGSALHFSFDGPATLTVVDGGFAGDAFQIFDNGVLLGQTSVASNSYPDSIVLDFDAALADPRYSRGVFQLGAGSHSITGCLRHRRWKIAVLRSTPLSARYRLPPYPSPKPGPCCCPALA